MCSFGIHVLARINVVLTQEGIEIVFLWKLSCADLVEKLYVLFYLAAKFEVVMHSCSGSVES